MADTNELTTLTDGVEICGFRIKPWSLSMLAALSPAVDRIMAGLRERGVTLERFIACVKAQTFDIDADILFCILPEAPAILAKTLGISAEDVDALDSETAGILISTIGIVNIAWLKNLSGPLRYLMTKTGKKMKLMGEQAT